MKIPEGFGTITPYFFVNEAEKLIDFLTNSFDGVEIGRTLRDDGKIANSQIRVGTTTIMISEAVVAYPAMPASYYIYVENADNSMARAIENGATLEMEVADMDYGDRQGGVVDPCGNIWWISQRLEDESYSF